MRRRRRPLESFPVVLYPRALVHGWRGLNNIALFRCDFEHLVSQTAEKKTLLSMSMHTARVLGTYRFAYRILMLPFVPIRGVLLYR